MIKKFIDTKIKWLFGLSIIYAVFSVFVTLLVDKIVHIAMVWNLFLAILPLIFSFYLIIFCEKKNKYMICLFALLWLFFFPNAPYVITDLVHISTVGIFEMNTMDIAHWFRITHFGLLIILALVFGMLSLYNVHNLVIKYKNKYYGTLFIVIVFLLSGYAIYIGRFLRFNSWDIFNYKMYVDLFINIDLFTITFTLLMAFYITFVYLIFYLLIDKKKGR